ncbi:MAG TPA: imidazolonepropionase [Candidatus Acidoferrales bacterium]|nr:imidazolonepropionase [Candidatus Acidoferrales bacterium]
MAIKKPASSKQTRRTDQFEPAVLMHSIGQLLTMRAHDASAGPRRGPEMRDIGFVRDGALLLSGGKIVAVGTTRELLRDNWVKQHRRELIELDCGGRTVLPGFVDSHTHPVFTAPRLIDFERRIAGSTYEEIAKAGGGIRASIEPVRKASENVLAEFALGAFREMSAHGTTTVEAKSGYGLSTASEIKSLKAIRKAAGQWQGTVVSTLLAAHVPPPEAKDNPDRYVDEICKDMIPTVARRKLAQFVDAFIERGAFTMEQAERIFAAAHRHGLQTRAHVGQLSHCELQPLLKQLPQSIDHVDHITHDEITMLARTDVVVTLVPGSNYFLGHKYPQARKLIEAGVAVALATDYNPGSSPTASMPFVFSLACTQMHMSPEEALVAGTINGAYALGLEATKGSLEPGKDADLAVFELEDYREIPYWFGSNHCLATMMAGRFFE